MTRINPRREFGRAHVERVEDLLSAELQGRLVAHVLRCSLVDFLITLLHLLGRQDLDLAEHLLSLGQIGWLLLISSAVVDLRDLVTWVFVILLLLLVLLGRFPRSDGGGREGAVIVKADGNELWRIADVILVEVIVIQV